MAEDVVVDTNVLMHADDPRSGRQEFSRDLLARIDDLAIPIRVDTQQRIFGEYLDYLASSSLGRSYLTKWISQKNYSLCDTKMAPQDSRWIGRNIGDSLDRVFVKVAMNSAEHDLVSHDFDDFPKRKRKEIQKRLKVRIATADEYL